MQAAQPIDVAAGAMAEALVTAATAPMVVATVATIAAADVWAAALARSMATSQRPAAWALSDRAGLPAMPLLWRLWLEGAQSMLSPMKPARPSAKVIDIATAYSAYRTAGGHAVAQITRCRQD
jgi:hypothetical protein